MAALTAPPIAAAQRIVADIGIRQGLITGHIVLGDPVRHQPRGGYLVESRQYDDRRYHAITVYSAHHGHGWYRHHGYRDTRLWFDAGRDAWYDRRDDRYPGTLREVAVFEFDGRYYLDDSRDGRSSRRGQYDENQDDQYERDDRGSE